MANFLGKQGFGFSSRRQPQFAGSWYEADSKKLQAQLVELLAKSKANLEKNPVEQGFIDNRQPQKPILAIVAPHAGYMFSGQTAAFAYEQAGTQKPKRVFLLGPSHYVGFHGAALPTDSIFGSPLGDVQIDTEVVQSLSHYPMFSKSNEVHKGEHSLEMQLPFIRQTFGAEVKVVPILIGNLDGASDIRLLAQLIRRELKDDDLIVVSSDFTHFGPRYGYEPFQTNLRENIRKLDGEAFSCLSEGNLDGFLSFKKRTNDTICGFYPLAVTIALLPEDSHASLLNYRTSQDSIVENDKNSVSYLALAFSNERGLSWNNHANDASIVLTEEEKSNLLKLARLTLEKFVTKQQMPDAATIDSYGSDTTRKNYGAFVTLYKVSSAAATRKGHLDRSEKGLRGCIGYIHPIKSLLNTVVDNTIGSCSRDPRFQPVIGAELKELLIDINVLTPPRPVASYNDIVVGRDGVILYKDGKQSVFLPSVATEFGWDLPELLTQLCIKANLPPNAWKQNAKFDVFQSVSFEEER